VYVAALRPSLQEAQFPLLQATTKIETVSVLLVVAIIFGLSLFVSFSTYFLLSLSLLLLHIIIIKR
jgi:hypothetical protein